MFRRLLWLVTLAALLLPAMSVRAQEARSVEVRLAALSRGYVRPMRATAERLAGVPGVESVETLGFAGDMARFRVKTSLENQALADALQMTLLGGDGAGVTLAAGDSARARRAEARGPIQEIAAQIMAQAKPSQRGVSEPLFAEDSTLKAKLEVLGLSIERLKGVSYQPADYHIEENWEGNQGVYRVWAGKKWEGIYVPDNSWHYDAGDNPGPSSEESLFVGMRLVRGAWQNSTLWVDREGLMLSGTGAERDALDASGKLCVRGGADWMQTILSAVGAYRVRKPKEKQDDLPQGRGWSMLSRLADEAERWDNELNRWDVRHYEPQCMTLTWREEDKRLIAVLTAHPEFHPFHLVAELDTQAVIDDYAKRDKKESVKLYRAELGEALTWVVAAEAGVEVFERRRSEARANCEALLKALTEAAKTHALENLCGRLDDAELVRRIGVELAQSAFKTGNYTITRQLLGDVEISVGGPRTGGRLWMLCNPAEGTLIRSNQ